MDFTISLLNLSFWNFIIEANSLIKINYLFSRFENSLIFTPSFICGSHRGFLKPFDFLAGNGTLSSLMHNFKNTLSKLLETRPM